MDKVQDKIINHLAEITGYDKSDISQTDSLVNDLGLDSMMIMDFHRLVVQDFPVMKEWELEGIFQKEDTTIENIVSFMHQELGIEQQMKPISLLEEFIEIEAFHDYIEKLEHIPYFRKNDGIATNKIVIDGEEKINFSTYNYGMSTQN
jgi:8-amino-7-oxononanoate synthase